MCTLQCYVDSTVLVPKLFTNFTEDIDRVRLWVMLADGLEETGSTPPVTGSTSPVTQPVMTG